MPLPELTDANLRAWRAKMMTAQQIADMTGTSKTAVLRMLRLYGLESLTALAADNGFAPTRDQMEQYLRDRKSYRQIGSLYGRGEDWARSWARRYGLYSLKTEIGRTNDQWIDVVELRRLCEAGHGIRYLAAHFKVRENSVKTAAWRHKISIPKQKSWIRGKDDPVGDAAFNRACAEFSRAQGGWVPAASSMGWAG